MSASDELKAPPARAPSRGRPPIEDEPRSATHRIRCTPSALERWRVAADSEGASLAEITRDLLDEWSERVLA